MRNHKAWGEQLRTWRQRVARSQLAFTDALSQTIRDLNADDEKQLREMRLLEHDGLTPGMLSRYELGRGVPEARGRHLLLLWGLTRAECALSPAEGNHWLMWGGQGLLTTHEANLIFGGGTPFYALPITPAREAALDDLVQQLLVLLRRLNTKGQ